MPEWWDDVKNAVDLLMQGPGGTQRISPEQARYDRVMPLDMVRQLPGSPERRQQLATVDSPADEALNVGIDDLPETDIPATETVRVTSGSTRAPVTRGGQPVLDERGRPIMGHTGEINERAARGIRRYDELGMESPTGEYVDRRAVPGDLTGRAEHIYTGTGSAETRQRYADFMRGLRGDGGDDSFFDSARENWADFLDMVLPESLTGYSHQGMNAGMMAPVVDVAEWAGADTGRVGENVRRDLRAAQLRGDTGSILTGAAVPDLALALAGGAAGRGIGAAAEAGTAARGAGQALTTGQQLARAAQPLMRSRAAGAAADAAVGAGLAHSLADPILDDPDARAREAGLMSGALGYAGRYLLTPGSSPRVTTPAREVDFAPELPPQMRPRRGFSEMAGGTPEGRPSASDTLTDVAPAGRMGARDVYAPGRISERPSPGYDPNPNPVDISRPRPERDVGYPNVEALRAAKRAYRRANPPPIRVEPEPVLSPDYELPQYGGGAPLIPGSAGGNLFDAGVFPQRWREGPIMVSEIRERIEDIQQNDPKLWEAILHPNQWGMPMNRYRRPEPPTLDMPEGIGLSEPFGSVRSQPPGSIPSGPPTGGLGPRGRPGRPGAAPAADSQADIATLDAPDTEVDIAALLDTIRGESAPSTVRMARRAPPAAAPVEPDTIPSGAPTFDPEHADLQRLIDEAIPPEVPGQARGDRIRDLREMPISANPKVAQAQIAARQAQPAMSPDTLAFVPGRAETDQPFAIPRGTLVKEYLDVRDAAAPPPRPQFGANQWNRDRRLAGEAWAAERGYGDWERERGRAMRLPKGVTDRSQWQTRREQGRPPGGFEPPTEMGAGLRPGALRDAARTGMGAAGRVGRQGLDALRDFVESRNYTGRAVNLDARPISAFGRVADSEWAQNLSERGLERALRSGPWALVNPRVAGRLIAGNLGGRQIQPAARAIDNMLLQSRYADLPGLRELRGLFQGDQASRTRAIIALHTALQEDPDFRVGFEEAMENLPDEEPNDPNNMPDDEFDRMFGGTPAMNDDEFERQFGGAR